METLEVFIHSNVVTENLMFIWFRVCVATGRVNFFFPFLDQAHKGIQMLILPATLASTFIKCGANVAGKVLFIQVPVRINQNALAVK